MVIVRLLGGAADRTSARSGAGNASTLADTTTPKADRLRRHATKAALISALVVMPGLAGGLANAAGASAAEFKTTLGVYPVELEAKNPSTNYHGFQISGAVSVCKKAKFRTGEGFPGAPNPTGPTSELSIHPEYSECTVELGGTHSAKVNTKECNYVFHAAEPNTKNGFVDIACVHAGEEIEVVVEGLPKACTIKVPAQNDLKAIEYINAAGKVEVKAEVTGIAWSVTSECPLTEKSGTHGEYRKGILNAGGEPELAPVGNPAIGLTTGFEPKTATKIAIEVS